MELNNDQLDQTFKAVLFSPDGDCVTDFKNCESVEEVWEKIENMGSRWIFYPICCVANNDNLIVDVPGTGDFDALNGITIADAKELIKADKDYINTVLS